MTDWLAPEYLPYIMSGILMVLIAAWLMVLDAAKPVNRVFAALLLFRATTMLVAPAQGPTSDLRDFAVANHIFVYANIALVPLVILFLSFYPRPRGIFATTRWAPAALIVATLAVELWYFFDHSIYTWVDISAGFPVFHDGPLLYISGLGLPAFAIAAILLARDYARTQDHSTAQSIFLVYAGFAINALVDGVIFTADLINAIQAGDNINSTYYRALVIPPTICLPLSLVSIGIVARSYAARRHIDIFREAGRFLFIVAPIAAITAVITTVPMLQDAEAMNSVIRAFWRLLVPFPIAYALLRYSLFNLDVRLKANVRRGIILAAFTIVFFFTTEAAEEVFIGSSDLLISIIAAAALAVVALPAQHTAQAAADRFMPETKPIHLMDGRERVAFYSEQYLLVGSDGAISDKERTMLDDLAETLRIDPSDRADIEAGKDVTMHVDIPAKPVEETRSWRMLALTIAMTFVFALVASYFETFADGGFATGLAVSALITLALGPIENLSRRILQPPQIIPENLALFEREIRTGLADGNWTGRDRTYIKGLATHLGIQPSLRRRMVSKARKARAGDLRNAAMATPSSPQHNGETP